MLPEPVSPELVLVDPDLARRERARLIEQAELAAIANVAALRRVVETKPAPTAAAAPRGQEWRGLADFSRRRLLPAVLMLGLLVSGLVAADLVAGAGSGASSQDRAALRVVTLGQGSSSFPTTPLLKSVGPETSATSASRPAITPEPSLRPGGAKAAVAKAAVERRLASLIISAPVRKLPRRFVDPTTGLIKNNVQVVCRRQTPRSFLCVVRLPNRAPKESLYVRYRGGRNGHGVFTWYGYRPGSSR